MLSAFSGISVIEPRRLRIPTMTSDSCLLGRVEPLPPHQKTTLAALALPRTRARMRAQHQSQEDEAEVEATWQEWISSGNQRWCNRTSTRYPTVPTRRHWKQQQEQFRTSQRATGS